MHRWPHSYTLKVCSINPIFRLYRLPMNAICTFAEAAKVLGYKSRSTLYKLKSDGWLDDYIIRYAGRDHLQLKPKGKPSLATHIMGVIQWRPSNPIRNQTFS